MFAIFHDFLGKNEVCYRGPRVRNFDTKRFSIGVFIVLVSISAVDKQEVLILDDEMGTERATASLSYKNSRGQSSLEFFIFYK